jgi:RND family efflux transporter MFP subunit
MSDVRVTQRDPVASCGVRRAGRPLGSWWIVAVAVTLGGGRAVAEDPSAEVIVLRRCPIDYERVTAVGGPSSGVLQDCLVAPGDRIEAGQILGRLQDDEVRAELKLREMAAGSDIQVRLSLAKEAESRNRLARTAALIRRNASSQEEYNLHRLEAEAAALAVEQARHEHELAQVQLRHAQAQVRARAFVSPHEGVLVALLKRRGEPVASNEVIFRVVDPRRLDIIGQVDVTDVWRLRVGQPVRVVPEIAGADLAVEREVFRGKVAFIDTHIDPLTRTCKVVAKVENRDGLLRSGLEARMEIDPSASADAGANPGPGGLGPFAAPPPTPRAGAPPGDRVGRR